MTTAARGGIGLWMIGARGSVATTATVGIGALASGASSTGLTTAGQAFADLPLVDLDRIVVGGHDVSETSIVAKAEALASVGMIPASAVESARALLEATESNLRPLVTEGPTQRHDLQRRAADIRSFQEQHGLDRVIVIDVASTEPIAADRPAFRDPRALEAALDDEGGTALPSSSVSALAALEAGAAYACFTPSTSINPPALRAKADASGLPYAGQDGKTGETLLRTVLAPLFTGRGMRVHSWAGTNLLGGGDGATLGDPEAVRSKLASKNRGLHALLGHDVVTPLHIDNVPDLGDRKVAWDHVSAEGFLGTQVVLQTTWSAFDSMLAAPLVIDLARLLDLALRAGEKGAVAELGCFFKDPWGSDVHAFAEQTRLAAEWASSAATKAV